MKKIFIIIIQILLYISSVTAENNTYTLKAVKFYNTFYAEWGILNDKEYEDRYDGMEFEIFQNNLFIGKIVAFQHWFDKNRKKYPEIGASINVEFFDWKVHNLPVDNYSIYFNALKIIQ
jgi:hypothetical protein